MTVLPLHQPSMPPSTGSTALDHLVSEIYARCGIPEPATSDEFNQVLSDAFIFGCGAFQSKVANGEVAVVRVKWHHTEGRS